MDAAHQPFTALLLERLSPARRTTVVDVGANPINPAPYATLLAMGGAHVVGFEPQARAFAALMASPRPEETYFNLAAGRGGPVTLHLYRSSGMTSVFPPHLPGLELIGQAKLGRVQGQERLETVALDAVEGLPEFDLLKIDIQGGELTVFEGARARMATCLAVIVELRYLRLYQGEPMLGGVDQELRAQGFELHKLMFTKSGPIANSQSARLKTRRVADQMIDGDAVYLRDPTRMAEWTDEQIKHLAILAASTFASHSLTVHCLDLLAARGAVAPDLPGLYVDALPPEFRAG